MNEEFLQVDDGIPVDQAEYEVGLVRKSPPSVYICNYRSIYEDSYPAKFDDELAEMLIKLYSEEGELVVDPCGGSGVVPLKAIELNRDAVYQDVNQKAYDIMSTKTQLIYDKFKVHGTMNAYVADSKAAIAHSRKAQLILFSPPFGLMISGAYEGRGMGPSGYSTEMEDIANAKDYDSWRAGLKEIIANCFDILEAGRLMIIEIRPRQKEGHAYPMNHWIWQDATEVGFEFWSTMIEVSQPWRIWTFRDKETKLVKPMPYHSYLLMFKKPTNGKIL